MYNYWANFQLCVCFIVYNAITYYEVTSKCEVSPDLMWDTIITDTVCLIHFTIQALFCLISANEGSVLQL